MKKVWAILLVALLFVAPAFALAQTGNVAGEWKLTKAAASGLVITPEAVGITDFTIVFNPDGTFTSHMATINGVTSEEMGTWSQLGVMVTMTSQSTGEVVSLSLQSDGTLRVMQDKTMMFFTQVAAAPQATAVPQAPVYPQATALPQATNAPGGGLLPSGLVPGDATCETGEIVYADLAGQWALTQVTANGQTFDAAAMGIQMTVTLNPDGTGMLSADGETVPCTWTQNGTTANVVEQDGYTAVFTLRTDGTISTDEEGMTMIFVRQSRAAAPSTPVTPVTPGMPVTPANIPTASGQTVVGKGFTLQIPQSWVEINEATVQQLTQTYGQAVIDGMGLRQQLQYTQSMGITLCYAGDLNASVNVVQESAQGITMETLLSLEASYAAAYANAGMTNYDMAGPVTFAGKTYYTGTYDAAYPTTQYYQIVNGMFYTITLTNVSDADAATMLGSFTVTQ